MILLCTLKISYAAAQQTDTLTYAYQSVRSVGFAFPAMNYSFLSPLNHAGYALAFHSNRFSDRPKHFSQFQMHSELGLMYNDVNDSYITSLAFQGGWSRYWHVTGRTRDLQLLCGAGIDAGADIYLKEDNTNNPLAYFFHLSVSPGILARYKFKSGKTRFDLSQQINIPAGSLVSSSGYSSTLPYGLIEEDADFFDAMRLTSFGSLKKVVAITGLDIKPSLEKRHKWPVFRISYMFSGMNYKDGDLSLKTANHVLMIGAIFHLFR